MPIPDPTTALLVLARVAGLVVGAPVLISLPFKLMLFVLVDGWNVLTGSLVQSFR